VNRQIITPKLCSLFSFSVTHCISSFVSFF
jgi:hypothetical protein